MSDLPGPAPASRPRTRALDEAAHAAPPKRPRPSAHALGLHTDLLALIFAYTPQAARIRTVSRVCKQWRVAALRSVSSVLITDRNCAQASRVFALLPQLRTLLLGPITRKLTVPTSVTQLRALVSIDGDLLDFAPDCRLLALTKSQATPEARLPLPQLSHLRSLHLHLDMNATDALELPALEHFAFRADDRHVALIDALLSRHATQLRSLDLFTTRLERVASHHFPSLTRLVVRVISGPSVGAPLRALLANCPRLTDLALHLAGGSDLLDLLPSPLTALRFLAVGGDLRAGSLSKFSNLRSLRSSTGRLEDSPEALGLCENVVVKSPAHWPRLRLATQLASLTVYSLPAPPPHELAGLSTRLHTLSVVLKSHDARQTLAGIRQLLDAAPTLTAMHLRLPSALYSQLQPDTIPVSDLQELCVYAQQRGVARISLSTTSARKYRPLEELGRDTGWLAVEVCNPMDDDRPAHRVRRQLLEEAEADLAF